jgi:sirohydrochlorin ferrochelatase
MLLTGYKWSWPGGGQSIAVVPEFLQPNPVEAVGILAAEGILQGVIMPYLVGQGKHATLELEEVIEGLQEILPQVRLDLANGLGADSHLADLVVDRVHLLDGSADSVPGEKNTVGVLLVKVGTTTQYDDCQWLEELGRMVENRLGLGYAVSVVQSHYGDLAIDAVAAVLVEKRQASSLVCVPYLFFPGMILRRDVLGGLSKLQQKYPDLPIIVAPPLGVDDRLGRWRQTGAGRVKPFSGSSGHY